MNADSVTDAAERWILVDLDRILRLPERLRRLWPPELLPHRQYAEVPTIEKGDAEPGTVSPGGAGPAAASAEDRGPAVASAKDSGPAAASAEDSGPAVASARRGDASTGKEDDAAGTTRELDVLTAWVHGFASELDEASTRITVVLSSGAETVHLALCLGAGIGHGVAVLQGEGFEDFAGHQLLRRIGPGQVGRVVEDLAELVEHDCVLTLSWAARGGAAGMEFLHRRGGAWYRPVLERRGDRVTVDADVEAGDAAVRQLLSAVLTRTLTMGVR